MLKESFYADGSPRTIEFYKGSLREGEVLLYWPNGRLKRRVVFSGGKRHGLDETWDLEGRPGFIGQYEADVAIGVHRRFHKGIVVEEVEW